jgi:hypothetical protein
MEEEQYKKLMARKIKGAKSTLAGHSGVWWHYCAAVALQPFMLVAAALANS